MYICHSREGGNPVFNLCSLLIMDSRLRGNDRNGRLVIQGNYILNIKKQPSFIILVVFLRPK